MTLAHHDDCPNCANLTERIVWLEDELGWRKDHGRLLALKQAFGLTPKESAILSILYSANGLPVPRHRLETATMAPDDEDDRIYVHRLVSVYIVRMRKKLGFEAIDTLRSRGYALSPEGLAKVNGVLGE